MADENTDQEAISILAEECGALEEIIAQLRVENSILKKELAAERRIVQVFTDNRIRMHEEHQRVLYKVLQNTETILARENKPFHDHDDTLSTLRTLETKLNSKINDLSTRRSNHRSNSSDKKSLPKFDWKH